MVFLVLAVMCTCLPVLLLPYKRKVVILKLKAVLASVLMVAKAVKFKSTVVMAKETQMVTVDTFKFMVELDNLPLVVPFLLLLALVLRNILVTLLLVQLIPVLLVFLEVFPCVLVILRLAVRVHSFYLLAPPI